MTRRYAIYYAPAPDTVWWRFGAHWLGRDERTGAAVPQALPPQWAAEELERITAEPRRYGFHATLKAPFRLHDGVTEEALLERVKWLARSLQPVALGTLVPVMMDGFVALVPASPNPALNALAETCVTELDDLRAPLSQADMERRRFGQLDTRGRELLERYGYPHVLERFRFHMTLSGPVDTAWAGRIVAQVARPVHQVNIEQPPALDRLCVFVEPEPGAAFLRTADAPLQP